MADEINVIINALLKDKQFKKTIKTMSTDMNKGSQKIKKDWTSVVIGFNQGLELMKKVWRGLKSAMNLARQFAEYRQGMDALARNTGQNADKIVKKLAEVTKGTVANKDVMLAANRLVALNVTKDTDKMAELFDIARLKAKAMGITTSQAINDISTGIGRQSPLILDNLGIITKGWDKEAKAAGKAMDSQFILNKILAQGREELKKTGARTVTGAERMQQFDASVSNLGIAFGRFVKDGLEPVVTWMTKVITTLGNMMISFAEARKQMDISKTVMKEFGIESSREVRTVEKLARAFEKWKQAGSDIAFIRKEREKWIAQGKDFDKAANENSKFGNRVRTMWSNAKKTLKETGQEMTNLKEILEDTQIATGEKAVEVMKLVNAEIERNNELLNQNTTTTEENGNVKKETLITLQQAQEEFYLFVDDQRQVDLLKEQQAFDKTIKLLDKALKQGLIKRKQHNQMVEEAQKKHATNLRLINDPVAKAIAESWKTASTTIADSYSDGIAKMIVSGDIFRKSFGDFIKELLKLFATLIIKALIFKGIMAAFGGLGGLFFNKGGVVPNVAYAAGGMRARGTDTQPAMLTPGERVLSVDSNKAFENLLRSIAIPTNVGTNNVNNSTTNQGDNFITNTFNNEFGNDSIDAMMDFSQRIGSRAFVR